MKMMNVKNTNIVATRADNAPHQSSGTAKGRLAGRMVGLGLAAVLSGALAGAPAEASFLYNFNLDTSTLTAGNTYKLDFQLNDGDLNNNNHVFLNNFNFGTGGSLNSPLLQGGASGDLSSGVMLTDSNFLNEFTQDFTAGDTLGFDFLSSNAFDNSDPFAQFDEFSFALLDGNGDQIPTTSPSGSLITANFNGDSAPLVQPYGSDTSGGAPALNPIVTAAPQTQPVPEPSTYAMMGLGAMAMLVMARRQKLLA